MQLKYVICEGTYRNERGLIVFSFGSYEIFDIIMLIEGMGYISKPLKASYYEIFGAPTVRKLPFAGLQQIYIPVCRW